MNLRILPHFIHDSRFLLQATKTLAGAHVALVINCIFPFRESNTRVRININFGIRESEFKP